MAQNRMIAGNWMDNGFVGNHDNILVNISAQGICDPVFGDEIYCRQYGNDSPILTNGCWEFSPDAGELERLGLVPAQMIA